VDEQDPGDGWSLPGFQIGPVLGRGGFSVVYLARQLSLGRDVAIKVLTADLLSEGDRRRFERERLSLARLSGHPYVVDVIDAGVTLERRPFVVMRLYSGGTLAELLARQGRLSAWEVTDVVAKLASALDAAHAIGVIHRDVKPQNCLLTESGEPALADFGISGILDPGLEGSHTSTGFFTLAHVAPEILEQHRYSVASDVYALASTAYQLLTGRVAFDPGDPRVGGLILDTPPPPIEVPGVPPGVAGVVIAAMAKDPAMRPPTAGAFAAALTAGLGVSADMARRSMAATERDSRSGNVTVPIGSVPAVMPRPGPAWPAAGGAPAARGVPTVGAVPAAAGGAPTVGFGTEALPPVGLAPGAGREVTRRPSRRTFLSALVLGVTATAGGTAAYLRTRADDGPGPTILDGHSAAVLAVAWSPKGTMLATCSGDQTVRLWDPATHRQLGDPLTGHTGWVWSLAWSPDEKMLATAGGEGDLTVRLWDVAGGQQLGVPLTGHTAGLWSVSWSSTGAALATASSDRTARIWNPTTHRQVGEPLTDPSDGVWSVAWSPNGETLATTGGDKDPTIRLWDSATRRQLGGPLTGHSGGVRAVAWSPDGKTLASASTDDTVRLWDPITRQQVGVPLTGHTNWVNGLAWNPDGKTLASAGGDGTVRLWDATTHRQLGAALTGHRGGVRAVAWSPDRKTLASAGTDHTVRLWPAALP
jgi:WD40 repeat protein